MSLARADFKQFLINHIRSGANLYAFLIVVASVFEAVLIAWMTSTGALGGTNAGSSIALLVLGFFSILFFVYRYARARMPKRARAYKLLIETPTQIKSIRLQVISGRYTFIITRHHSGLPQMLTFTSRNKANLFKSYVKKLLPQVEIG